MQNAEIIFRDKYVFADGAIREMIIWRLPTADVVRPHGLKYSLYYGFPGTRLVGYDNELGKGDHRHYGDREEPYNFSTIEQLVAYFEKDIDSLRSLKP